MNLIDASAPRATRPFSFKHISGQVSQCFYLHRTASLSYGARPFISLIQRTTLNHNPPTVTRCAHTFPKHPPRPIHHKCRKGHAGTRRRRLSIVSRQIEDKVKQSCSPKYGHLEANRCSVSKSRKYSSALSRRRSSSRYAFSSSSSYLVL